MSKSIVALDIETTGLSHVEDAIIEIGAVRFNDNRVEDEWTTLVNPGRRIPPFITNLTGITDSMVVAAPVLADVINDLADFAGNAPILGHNIAFDLSFFRRHNILKYNDAIDTYEMAAVLLPGASRYNLGALTQALGVPFPATHRALDDAHATRGIYLRLLEEARHLPPHLLAELLRLAEMVDWGAYLPFSQVLTEKTGPGNEPKATSYRRTFFSKKVDHPHVTLTPKTEPLHLDYEEADAVLEQVVQYTRK